jgi:hypothetical protein
MEAPSLRCGIGMLKSHGRLPCSAGVRILKGWYLRFALALVPCLTIASEGSAETAADTVHKWGLIGPWSRDCSRPADRNNDTLLAYEIVRDGRVVFRRNFGDTAEESEVVAAEVSGDGMLNLRVFFPGLRQIRESGLMMQPDGSMRAMYNRSPQGEYTIRDGKFTANGDPTPPLRKCE